MMTTTKPSPDNFHFAFFDQRAMLLHSGVGAKSITRVHFKLNEVAVKMLAVLAEIDRFWVAAPLYPCATGIDELVVEPFHYDFLIVGGIWTIQGLICR